MWPTISLLHIQYLALLCSPVMPSLVHNAASTWYCNYLRISLSSKWTEGWGDDTPYSLNTQHLGQVLRNKWQHGFKKTMTPHTTAKGTILLRPTLRVHRKDWTLQRNYQVKRTSSAFKSEVSEGPLKAAIMIFFFFKGAVGTRKNWGDHLGDPTPFSALLYV